ncbi:MAG: helix-turn-helix transcriptional regulator [Micrococcaceae bacterium]
MNRQSNTEFTLNQFVSAEIRAEMSRIELKQNDLAKKSGLSEPTINKTHAGKRDIRLSDLIKICKVLKISPATILKRAEEKMSEVSDTVKSSSPRELSKEFVEAAHYQNEHALAAKEGEVKEYRDGLL